MRPLCAVPDPLPTSRVKPLWDDCTTINGRKNRTRRVKYRYRTSEINSGYKQLIRPSLPSLYEHLTLPQHNSAPRKHTQAGKSATNILTLRTPARLTMSTLDPSPTSFPRLPSMISFTNPSRPAQMPYARPQPPSR